MRNLLKLFVFSILITSLAESCTNPNEDINANELIQNPNSAEGNVDQSSLPVFDFKYTEHDFGKLIDGVKVSFTYKFKNTGGSPLIIHQVKTSCGCTASEYTKEPVAPGAEGKVQLTFDSSNRRGFNSKVATIVANTQPNTVVLKFKAMVVSPDEL